MSDRNLNPHREARLAMLVWHDEYAAQRGGSMDFYDSLTAFQKKQLRGWCDELCAEPSGGALRETVRLYTTNAGHAAFCPARPRASAATIGSEPSGLSRFGPCNCGHDALRAAIDAALNEEGSKP